MLTHHHHCHCHHVTLFLFFSFDGGFSLDIPEPMVVWTVDRSKEEAGAPLELEQKVVAKGHIIKYPIKEVLYLFSIRKSMRRPH